MSWLARLALASLGSTLVLAGHAMTTKVRIDARARLIQAESLRLGATRSLAIADLAAAGRAYARALASYTPGDPSLAQAARGLESTVLELLERGDPEAARDILAAGLSHSDLGCRLFHPLAGERAELERMRDRLLPPGAGSAPPGPAPPPAGGS